MVHTPVRSVRVSDDVWQAAKSRAGEEGMTLSRALVLLIRSYAVHALDIPGELVPEQEPPAPQQCMGPASAGRVRVVDITCTMVGQADPPIFENAVFKGQVWAVTNVRELLARLTNELLTLDRARLMAAPYALRVIHESRTPNTRYVPLSQGGFLMVHWATRHLLDAAQEFISAFGLDDEVFVTPRKRS